MKVYKNILSKKERLKLLKFVKTKLENLGPDFPGLQTRDQLHRKKELLPLINEIGKINTLNKKYGIQKCWGNHTVGDYLCWHSHPNCDLSLVYYLQNKSEIGTVFKKDNFNVYVSKCPENSLLIFDSNQVHSVPYHLKEDRYSIAFDLIKI
tara:strand:- start:116 stop:568 length:453 start_codon:yes stop_codon:yes gene_type:complete